MKKLFLIIILIISVGITSCDKYMDIVPDNVPTLDNAFASRVMAERYLNTCYSYMPGGFEMETNPAFFAADELWLNSTNNFLPGTFSNWYIALGNQNANSPLNNYWDGNNQGKALWRAIRDCNIFLENITQVPDMDALEIKRWVAEVNFLKAYYHYYLLRMYGPVHIMDKNIPTTADPLDTQIEREPIDDCINYIIGLIDSASPDLPDDITTLTEYGRISKLVAYSMKAEILVTAASPLFNGNTDYSGFKNAAGKSFFNPTFSNEKWVKAADACQAAIQFNQATGRALFAWKPPITMTTTPQVSTVNQMSFREAIAERQNNPEQIWVNNVARATRDVQAAATIRSYDPAFIDNSSLVGYLAPTINMVSLFYSNNGVPIDEDLSYDYGGRFALRTVPTGTSKYMYNLTAGYTTIGMHFDREDRFYASLSFDGGRYLTSVQTNDNSAFNTNYKAGGNAGVVNVRNYSATGYTPKKLASYRNVVGASNAFTVYEYPYPIMRMADLYLLFAEASNEAKGPNADAFAMIDLVRKRAGLLGVQESWTNFARNPNKPNTKEGFRDIIRRERTIELMFEGKRFWDLRRWKTASHELNTNIFGWSVREKDPQLFYRQTNLYSRTFAQRDYLWPLSLNELRRNSKLSQNPGW